MNKQLLRALGLVLTILGPAMTLEDGQRSMHGPAAEHVKVPNLGPTANVERLRLRLSDLLLEKRLESSGSQEQDPNSADNIGDSYWGSVDDQIEVVRKELAKEEKLGPGYHLRDERSVTIWGQYESHSARSPWMPGKAEFLGWILAALGVGAVALSFRPTLAEPES